MSFFKRSGKVVKNGPVTLEQLPPNDRGAKGFRTYRTFAPPDAPLYGPGGQHTAKEFLICEPAYAIQNPPAGVLNSIYGAGLQSGQYFQEPLLPLGNGSSPYGSV